MRALWLTCLLLVAFCLTATASAQLQEFTGWVLLKEGPPAQQSLIVTNAKELASFQKMLPTKVPSKRAPAPKNKDPLLQSKPIDFKKNILVLALRNETISAHPELVKTEIKEKTTILHFEIPEASAEARPFGWGVYRGVLIPRTSKEIKVVFKEQRTP